MSTNSLRSGAAQDGVAAQTALTLASYPWPRAAQQPAEVHGSLIVNDLQNARIWFTCCGVATATEVVDVFEGSAKLWDRDFDVFVDFVCPCRNGPSPLHPRRAGSSGAALLVRPWE